MNTHAAVAAQTVRGRMNVSPLARLEPDVSVDVISDPADPLNFRVA